jgi:hypothetical protein
MRHARGAGPGQGRDQVRIKFRRHNAGIPRPPNRAIPLNFKADQIARFRQPLRLTVAARFIQKREIAVILTPYDRIQNLAAAPQYDTEHAVLRTQIRSVNSLWKEPESAYSQSCTGFQKFVACIPGNAAIELQI